MFPIWPPARDPDGNHVAVFPPRSIIPRLTTLNRFAAPLLGKENLRETAVFVLALIWTGLADVRMLPVLRKSHGSGDAAHSSKGKHGQADLSLLLFTAVFQPVADNREPGQANQNGTEQKDAKKHDRT